VGDDNRLWANSANFEGDKRATRHTIPAVYVAWTAGIGEGAIMVGF